jgi:hypothetical protein
MTDAALLFRNPVLLALELVAHSRAPARNIAKLGMAQRALVLVEVVLTAPEALWIFEFWVADKAAIFITVMLRTPQASRIPQTGVADETAGNWKIVARATFALLDAVRGTINMLLRRGLERRPASTTPRQEQQCGEGRGSSFDQLNPIHCSSSFDDWRGSSVPGPEARASVIEAAAPKTAAARSKGKTESIQVSL